MSVHIEEVLKLVSEVDVIENRLAYLNVRKSKLKDQNDIIRIEQEINSCIEMLHFRLVNIKLLRGA